MMRNQPFYDLLLYLVWCLEFEKDFQLASSHQAWEEFLKDTDIHSGDCTQLAGPCTRCALQRCEVAAENMYLMLQSFIHETKQESEDGGTD